MQYEPGTEKVAMMDGPYTPPSKPLTLAEDPHVQRPRKILLIMLSICLGLCLVNTIVGIVNPPLYPHAGVQFALPLFSIVFYGFGLVVTYKYYETGLRVFAWLGVIMLVGIGIVLGFVVITVIASLAFSSLALAAVNTADMNSMANSTAINSVDKKTINRAVVGFSAHIYLFFLVCISIFIFTIIMIKFAFKLARFIETKRNLIIQQI